MKRILSIITAGLIALLSFNSCEFQSEFAKTTYDAFLTCNYAGGLPPVTVFRSYETDMELQERDIEEMFYAMTEMIKPGFVSATLTLDKYDWMGNYELTRVFEFWWETTNPVTGDGYYAWDEFFE